jgi:hypothetical protein
MKIRRPEKQDIGYVVGRQIWRRAFQALRLTNLLDMVWMWMALELPSHPHHLQNEAFGHNIDYQIQIPCKGSQIDTEDIRVDMVAIMGNTAQMLAEILRLSARLQIR